MDQILIILVRKQVHIVYMWQVVLIIEMVIISLLIAMRILRLFGQKKEHQKVLRVDPGVQMKQGRIIYIVVFAI